MNHFAQRAALGATAAVTLIMGAVATAPAAQAAETCNSTRLCLYAPNGSIANIDPDVAIPACSTGGLTQLYNLEKAYNRSNRAFTVYSESGALLSRLDPGETITYTPTSYYYFCRWGL
ncbi:hypothetical protein ACGFZJ_11905 [Streptomyces sp. NPDC048253]|uniref:cupredoxin domain-containing protein n=1 Tax=Streptomyces sp. NPDC048253 TaxID=3365524 RepID=UPI00370F7940